MKESKGINLEPYPQVVPDLNEEWEEQRRHNENQDDDDQD
jgi:hypothetical protein